MGILLVDRMNLAFDRQLQTLLEGVIFMAEETPASS